VEESSSPARPETGDIFDRPFSDTSGPSLAGVWDMSCLNDIEWGASPFECCDLTKFPYVDKWTHLHVIG
jgi:hypothetical protein